MLNSFAVFVMFTEKGLGFLLCEEDGSQQSLASAMKEAVFAP